MAVKKDFQVDPRVFIAYDAMTPSQKAALKPVLSDKQGFLAHASRAGMSQKVSATKPLYKLRAGNGLRVFYSQDGDNIVVLDVYRKATMDGLATKKRSTKKASGNTPVNRDDAAKLRKS